MQVLVAATEDFIKRERTVLTGIAAAGSSVSVPVANTDGYATNQYVVIGLEGSSQAELTQITNVTGESIVVSLLKLTHQADEPVVGYRYNARKFYGSTTSGGSYNELTAYGSPVTIQVNDPLNTILEYTGSEGYIYFKATYFNTTTSDETNISDATETLADESLRYTSIYSIRKQAGLQDNPYITDGDIEVYRKRAENEINSYIMQRYILPLTNTTTNLTEVPFIIDNACSLLAAGYMDYREYGSDGQGVKWLGEARGLLSAIRKGTQRLLGTDNNELLLRTTTEGLQSYPNRVDNHGSHGPKRFFSTNQSF